MDTPNLQRILEQKLAEAKTKEDEATQERERIESAFNAYMAGKPTGRRRSIPGQHVAESTQQSMTMYDRIAGVVQDFDTSQSFNAKAVFEGLGRDEDKYESTRPTIVTALQQLKEEGEIEKVGHGVYQRKINKK